MSLPPPLAALPGARCLQGASGRGGGNFLVVVPGSSGPRLLKVYRGRRTRLRSALQALSHRLFEGKRGVSPRARWETERRSLALWAAAGVRVPAVLNAPPPPGLPDPSLWLEYCPGPTLHEVLSRTDVSWDDKAALLRRFGADVARRFGEAARRVEPLLLHEHGTTKHVLLLREGVGSWAEAALCWFDLEGGFRAGFPILEAQGQELGGHLRSIAKALPERVDDAFRALIADPTAREPLHAAALHGAHSRGLLRRIRRAADRSRRPRFAKTALLERLAALPARLR